MLINNCCKDNANFHYNKIFSVILLSFVVVCCEYGLVAGVLLDKWNDETDNIKGIPDEMPFILFMSIGYWASLSQVQSMNVNWPGAVTSYLTVCIVVEPVYTAKLIE